MNGICLIGLIPLVVFSVNAYPPCTYSAPASVDCDQQKLSDEAVAAYFKRKFENEDVKPAMVMEYVVELMKGEQAVTCVNGGTDDSLTKSQLELVLNTVSSSSVPSTLVTPNHGHTMYVTESNDPPLHPFRSYQKLLNDIRLGHIEDTGNIWTNYSPCPNCARALLQHYNKPGTKPTIHIARIYTVNNTFDDAVTALQCLAKLEHEGFRIAAWDFNQFKQYITKSCADEIDERNKGNFEEEYMKLATQIEFIHEVSPNSHADSWCE